MKRGTTPTVTLTVDTNITDWTVHVAFKSSGKVFVFENDRLQMSVEDGVTTILLTLTQEETLAMYGSADVQVRAIHDGTAITTNKERIEIGSIIEDGVIDE